MDRKVQTVSKEPSGDLCEGADKAASQIVGDSPVIAWHNHEVIAAMQEDVEDLEPPVSVRRIMREDVHSTPSQFLHHLMTAHLLARMQGSGHAVVITAPAAGTEVHVVQPPCTQACPQPTPKSVLEVDSETVSGRISGHSETGSCGAPQMVRIITTDAFARLVGDNASKRAAAAAAASGAAAAERATVRR